MSDRMRNQQNMLEREKLKTSSSNSSRIQYQEDTPIDTRQTTISRIQYQEDTHIDSLPSLGYNIMKILL